MCSVLETTVTLDPNEAAITFRSGDASGAGTAEWVEDEIAGMAGAEHDRANDGQRELSGENRRQC